MLASPINSTAPQPPPTEAKIRIRTRSRTLRLGIRALGICVLAISALLMSPKLVAARPETDPNADAFADWGALVSSPKGSLPPPFDFDGGLETKPPKVERLDNDDDSDSDKLLNSSSDFAQPPPPPPSAAAPSGCVGSIAQRRAVKCGFNASRISAARFRTSPLSSPAARSPCLTIPPGISPTALLDSPIMLPNSQAQPSPTTGTFPIPTFNKEPSLLNPLTSTGEVDRSSNIGSSFRFIPHGSPVSLPHVSGIENQSLGIAVDYQDATPLHPSSEFEFPAELPKEVNTRDNNTDSPDDVKVPSDMIVDANYVTLQGYHPDVASEQILQPKEPFLREDVGTHNIVEGDQKEACPPSGIIRTSEDGYNWRKYGQKQVKGSEYPRSYYKCTNPNCLVKKKVERSHDGQITEIIYKGAHNHPKPQLSRRSALAAGYLSNDMMEMGEGSGSSVKAEGWSVWKNLQSGSKEIKASSDWKTDGLERTSSTSVLTELSDPLSNTQGKSGGVFESAETPELSSTLASHDDDDDDMVTQGSISLGEDADDEESDSKRRKRENCLIGTNMSSRAVREPRVVVQIESEIDILDDGYRWRKYGQKIVKGNPNPRSYYKCTSAGCLVRKHVERASNNLNSVITTYDGKHNHEVPAARNSNHAHSSGSHLPPAAPNVQGNLALPRSANAPKSEANIQDLVPHFERKPEFSTEFLRPSFFGNFGNDMKFGASPIYQMKFPPIHSTMPYGSYGLNPARNETNQTCNMTHVVPDFPISLPLSLPTSANLALTGFEFSNHGKPIVPVLPHNAGQHVNDSDLRFIRPKQEQKDESMYGACLPIIDHGNASVSSSSSSSSSVYCQLMGNYP